MVDRHIKLRNGRKTPPVGLVGYFHCRYPDVNKNVEPSPAEIAVGRCLYFLQVSWEGL